MTYYIRYTLLFLGLQCLFFSEVRAQQWAVKTNLLNDVTGTASLGLEYGFSPRYSFEVSGSYKAWDFSDSRKYRILSVQPEVRYWFCERLNGHFIGVHAHWAKFNLAHLDLPFGIWKNLNRYRYQGDLWGGGVSYGYHWLLSEHWNLETVIGVGYARVVFDQYPCAHCGSKLASDRKNYWGPTKAAVSLVYLF